MQVIALALNCRAYDLAMKICSKFRIPPASIVFKANILRLTATTYLMKKDTNEALKFANQAAKLTNDNDLCNLAALSHF